MPSGYSLGPVNSEYVMQQAAQQKQSEYEMNKASDSQEQDQQSQEIHRVPSQYAAQGLETIVTLESNPLYQHTPQKISNNHVIPGAGTPLSAAQLKERVAALEDKVYTPALINGALFFVSNDNDTKTARSSDEPAPEPTFTLAQLQHFFGSDVASKFATSVQAGQTALPESLGNALRTLSKARLAQSQVSITGDDVSTAGSATAMSRTMLTAADTLSVRTAASRDNISRHDNPTSGVVTAMSRTMLTGAEASDPAVTAVSRTMLTGAEASDQAVTARSRSMMTGLDRSASCATGRANSTTAMTAMSRTMLTGAEASDPAVTAMSRTMLTGAEASDLARTAVSRTMMTGAEKSLSVSTARGEFWEDDMKTALQEMQTVWEKQGLSMDDLKTAVSSSSEALAQSSTAGIPPYKLTSTPSTDPTAANAVPSIDTMTALEA